MRYLAFPSIQAINSVENSFVTTVPEKDYGINGLVTWFPGTPHYSVSFFTNTSSAVTEP
jgi:hypothetical protein